MTFEMNLDLTVTAQQVKQAVATAVNASMKETNPSLASTMLVKEENVVLFPDGTAKINLAECKFEKQKRKYTRKAKTDASSVTTEAPKPEAQGEVITPTDATNAPTVESVPLKEAV